jgi:PAS domain S-box-containing protein
MSLFFRYEKMKNTNERPIVNDGTQTRSERGTLRGIQQTLQKIIAEVEARPARLADILVSAEEALIAFNSSRSILCANHRAEDIFGYEPGALKGHQTDMLIPARLRQPDAPPMIATADLMQVELPGLMRDGRERDIEWCFGAACLETAPIFIATVRDRSELVNMLDALRLSEERFQLFVNGVRDCAIFMLDAAGRVSSWNVGAAHITGWSASEIQGKPYEIFFTTEDRAAGLPAQLMGDAKEDGSRNVTGWRVRKDGSRFWAHGSLTVLRNTNGDIYGFAKITRDLTERRQAEEVERRLIAERAAREAAQEAEQRLREGEEKLWRLQRLTAALSEAVTPENVSKVILDECVNALGASACAVYLLGSDGNNLELFGQCGHPETSTTDYLSIPLEVHTPITDAARERLAKFYENLESCWKLYPAHRDAISAGNFEASVALPLVAHGTLVGALGLRFDSPRIFSEGDQSILLTVSDLCSQAFERARLFAGERAARADAESASRSKDEFLAMLGHELRNPLAPISTAIQIMKLRGDERSLREREVIERQVMHLSRLVDDLLDVSRVARGLLTLSRVHIEVQDVLTKAVELASPLIEQREQHLIVSTTQSNLWINADPLRLSQVVANLLTNAAKYTPPRGHVWLSAAREEGYVVIRVRDDGEGIGANLLPHVFDLFVQGMRTVARSEGGLGLGLALVKSFVTLHEGTVFATSEGPSRGSEFVVSIPAVASMRVTVPNAMTPPPLSPGGKRILVVDDNEDAREMLADLLRSLGHEVVVADDGPGALRRLEAFPAEVAILDLGLPVMDGFELARRVRERQSGSRLRLIALTGYGRERDFAQSHAVGFDAHLVKPVDLSALNSAINPESVRTSKLA